MTYRTSHSTQWASPELRLSVTCEQAGISATFETYGPTSCGARLPQPDSNTVIQTKTRMFSPLRGG